MKAETHKHRARERERARGGGRGRNGDEGMRYKCRREETGKETTGSSTTTVKRVRLSLRVTSLHVIAMAFGERGLSFHLTLVSLLSQPSSIPPNSRSAEI